MSTRLFGTDGVRGVAGLAPLDPETIARLGRAIVRTRHTAAPVRIVVGRDTRESGGWIERALAEGAASAGARVTGVGVVPTPAVAYLAGAEDFDLGLVISASHNPYGDNGIKVFSGKGEKFGEADERAVEAEMTAGDATTSGVVLPELAESASDNSGKTTPEVVDKSLLNAYLDHVTRLLPDPGPLKHARIAIDMANGATTTTAARVLGNLGFDVLALGDTPNGRNINLDCGSTHPARLAAAVVANKCRLGAAFDGDGDRVILVDARGHVVDGDAVLLTLGLAYHRHRRLTGDTVVATVMSNIGLEIALGRAGIKLVRTPVGDKYVMDEMLRGGFVLGGEQSGHVIMTEHLPTGDGLATTLAILRVMAESGRELFDLASDLVTYPQTLVNVRVRERTPVESVPAMQAALARVEAALDGRGRVLVRYSGTEPLLRIMIEGEDQATVQAWAEEIAEAVRRTLA